MRQRLRNKGTRKQRERGCTRHAVKQLVKDMLLYNGKVPVNLELRPLRRETRNGSSAIRHFERFDEEPQKGQVKPVERVADENIDGRGGPKTPEMVEGEGVSNQT